MIGDKCKEFKRCDSSAIKDNETYPRGTCGENNFCRDNVCLCLPNYKFDSDGNCIAQFPYDQGNFVGSRAYPSPYPCLL